MDSLPDSCFGKLGVKALKGHCQNTGRSWKFFLKFDSKSVDSGLTAPVRKPAKAFNSLGRYDMFGDETMENFVSV